MAQVLKDEIFDRIFHAGVEVFYEKDFRTAKMKEIAERAEIPVGLIYSYYKNKEELFIKIVSSLPVNFEKLIEEEENSDGLPSERYKNVAEKYLLDLLEHHKIFVILYHVVCELLFRKCAVSYPLDERMLIIALPYR